MAKKKAPNRAARAALSAHIKSLPGADLCPEGRNVTAGSILSTTVTWWLRMFQYAGGWRNSASDAAMLEQISLFTDLIGEKDIREVMRLFTARPLSSHYPSLYGVIAGKCITVYGAAFPTGFQWENQPYGHHLDGAKTNTIAADVEFVLRKDEFFELVQYENSYRGFYVSPMHYAEYVLTGAGLVAEEETALLTAAIINAIEATRNGKTTLLDAEWKNAEIRLNAQMSDEARDAGNTLTVIAYMKGRQYSSNFQANDRVVYRINRPDHKGAIQITKCPIYSIRERFEKDALAGLNLVATMDKMAFHPLLMRYLEKNLSHYLVANDNGNAFGMTGAYAIQLTDADGRPTNTWVKVVGKEIRGRFDLSEGVVWEYDRLVLGKRFWTQFPDSIVMGMQSTITNAMGQELAQFIDLTAIPGMEDAIIKRVIERKNAITIELDVEAMIGADALKRAA